MRMPSPGGQDGPSSRLTDIDGPYHYLDYGAQGRGPILVCLHGLSGSSETWAPIAPELARIGRVLAVDLVGFGRTGRAGRSVSLPANQRYLDRFLRATAGEPAILVGHSMGATIAVMQAARHPETAAGLVLINPAVPWHFEDRVSPLLASLIATLGLLAATVPGPGRRRRARVLRQLLRDFMRARYPDLIPAAVKVVMSGAAKAPLGERTANPATRAAFRSLVWTLTRRWRFAAIARKVRAPVLLLHGDRDRLVPSAAVSAMAAANPSWHVQVAHSVGHFPPQEVPEWTTDRILEWLDQERLRPW